MIRAKNSFYRKLKLDSKSQDTLAFFRDIKELMLKDVDGVPLNIKEREKK